MLYQYTSVNEVIGRVLRNTRLTDTGVISDIPVWIGDAMEMLQTSSTLESVKEIAEVKFFQAKIPCGLVELEAVTHNGIRLMLDNSSIYQLSKRSGHNEAYQNNIKIIDPFLDHVNIAYNQGTRTTNKYYLKPGYICMTELKKGEIEIHFNRHACDEDGFPLIPDNGNYKEAIYWFVRGKLIGAGILEETRAVNEHICNEKFEVLSRRAINEITYPSVDKMERVRANQVNFAIPENYWSNFNRVHP